MKTESYFAIEKIALNCLVVFLENYTFCQMFILLNFYYKKGKAIPVTGLGGL
jgi:hypothetical protein